MNFENEEIMHGPALSIIVPVYRVEQYLTECIDSILAQTFTDWELILVDDGSPDGSGAICDRYAARDSRIRVIHKPNGGVSAARNDALDIARGRYITFVDSDDYLGSVTTYGENIEILETYPEVDIVQYPGGDGVGRNRTYAGKAAILEAIVRWHISGYLWDKIFRREVFENVRLPKGIQFAEDTWCLIDMADNNVRAVYVSDKGRYFYRRRDDSAVSTFTATQCLNLFQMSFHLLYELNKTQGVSSETNVSYFMVTYRRLLDAWIVNADLPCFNEYLNGIATLPPPSIKHLAKKGLSLKQRLWLLAIKCMGVRRFANCYVGFVRRRMHKA